MDQGWSPQCFNYPAENDQWGVLKVGCVNGYKFSPSENKVLPPNLKPIADLEVKHKDILISRANTLELVGSAACAINPRSKLIMSDKIFRVLVNETQVIPEYFVLLLQVKMARKQIEAGANGASFSMQNIGQDIIKNLWMPVPPIEEQREILNFITNFSDQQHQLVASIMQESQALKELKQVVIAKAVTGKIKI
jgi:type I restriction enzyme, S subunit